ncbi:TonB-dependent receptor [Luteolibacter sp. LG18]|uniref:TonB-dependent receptor plug domain-containing protein n=1 Tax=Luteolibacter sp. LG18 TaxID=2819286 RepID=UPI002B28AFC7|nr:TonB-dependent receptor [Luteolibacter sp. LG18]
MTKRQFAPALRRGLVTFPRLCASGLVAAPLAMADVEAEPGDMVVSALRFKNEAGKTTSAVTVLDPRELQERGIDDLISALNQSPGVIATSTAGQGGAVGSLFIRGTTTNYSQIVVDGMRLSDSTAPLGNFLGTSRIDDLGRIEVLRGPQSALYGGEAVGGVVWLETARGAGNPGGNLRLEAGSFGSLSGYASTSGKTGDVSWFLGGGYDTTQNDSGFSDWDQGRGAARIEWQATPDLVIGGTFRETDSRFETGANGTVDHLDAQLGTLYADWKVTDWWTARVQGGYYAERYDDDWAPTNPFPIFGNGNYGTDLERAAFSTDHLFKLDDCNRLLWGAFFERTDFSNTIGTDETRDRYGSYLGWEWTPTDRITTDAIVRWEDYDSYGDEVTWRTAAAWKVPGIETTVRAGVGRSFRPPTYLDLFGSAFGAGNPNLQAESSIGWDLGLEKEWLPNHHVGVTWFSSAIEDRIRSNPAPPVNIPGTTHAEGVEAALNGSFCDGVWNYRLAWTVLTMSLADQPKNSGTASVDWRPDDRWLLGVGAFYLGDRSWGGQPLKEAFVARVYGEYKLTEHVTLTGRVENLFDEDWQLSRFPFSPVVNAPGLGAYAGVKIDW